MKTIYFITGNKGKYNEVKEKMKSLNVNIIQKNLGYPEIQANTLEEVVKYGVEHLQNKLNQPFIIEDAGLFIDELEGFPGVYSKHVFYTIGCTGILKLMEDKNKKSAVFRSVYAYSESDGTPEFFIGDCIGTIANKEKGTGGFGYDPIFIPDGETRTFAEMKVKEKNMFSHRGKALDKLLDFLKDNKCKVK